MTQIIQRKHASLRSSYPRADICLLMEDEGLVAFMDDAQKIHRLLPHLPLQNFGDEAALDDAFVCAIPLTEALQSTAKLTTKHSVALCERIMNQGFVAFAFYPKQPQTGQAVQEPETEDVFI